MALTPPPPQRRPQGLASSVALATTAAGAGVWPLPERPSRRVDARLMGSQSSPLRRRRRRRAEINNRPSWGSKRTIAKTRSNSLRPLIPLCQTALKLSMDFRAQPQRRQSEAEAEEVARSLAEAADRIRHPACRRPAGSLALRAASLSSAASLAPKR